MKQILTKASTDVTLIVFVQDSSSTTGAGLTGLVYNSAGLACYYVRPGSAAAALSLATQTVTGAHADGGFVEIDSTNMAGFYRLDLSDAVCATGVDSVAMSLRGASNMAPLSIEVQLIDQTGHNHGPIDTMLALQRAQEAGLDLVEIAPNSVPPVAKLLDYGKYKYQAQKKAAEARKKQKVVEVKEIKLRPMIDDHDYDVKMRSMQRFFEEGDKVKVTLRFRGRELAHQDPGYKLLNRVKDDTSKLAKVEQEPRFEGRQVVMVLAPR